MIRRATAHDALHLWALMRQLAQFEGYADRFAVSEGDLIDRGLNAAGTPEFTAWVAAGGGALQGYAIAYVIPFTFDLRPTVVLKELYVVAEARGKGLGHQLFDVALRYARSTNSRLLRWQVLPENTPAKRFYSRIGGAPDLRWENWEMSLDVIS